MKTRMLSALLLIPLFAILYFGSYPLFIMCIALSVIGMHEFYEGFENINVHPISALGYGFLGILVYLISTCYFFTRRGIITFAVGVQIWLFCAVIAAVLYAVFSESHDILDGPIAILGALYVGYLLMHIVLIDRSGVRIFTWLVFLASFGSDIGAYFVGTFFGKHKLCPDVSPNKTIEGLIGGIACSALLCTVFGIVFAKNLIVHCCVIGVIGAAVSVLGDLTESAFKRKLGIKDFGDVIPGHGGVLDRFDSVIFVAPFVYYYILLFIA